ncbi:MAG: UDP-3-O-(3-hydroxymyristoyl)glucosamine N-acyltransferase [Akkermansiaceae bacterium]|nr:UDP-3-O-(3-hydroxymyristoyl)glucosamine N-acyltransferase [Akkermansiaceae bacterium]
MKLTLDELVSLTGGKLIRPGNAADITGVASLDEADSGDVSFLGNEKYYHDFLETDASAVLVSSAVPADPAPKESVALIEVENPSFSFGQVVKHFISQGPKFVPGISPAAHIAEDAELDPEQVCVKAGAVIESGASIGNGTEIGSGSVVGAGVRIGENCLFHANTTIREGCIIGNRVILQPGCVIGSDGYGYELVDGKHVKVDQVGIVVLGDDVEIGANSTIDRARFGKTVVGEGTKIDNLVQIGHNVTTGKHCLVVAQSGLSGSAKLGNYVTMAAKSGCVGHIKIGDHAIVTAKAGVMGDLDGGEVYMGMPARKIKETLKVKAHVARLPKLAATVRELRSRLDQLESGQSD